MSYVYINRVMTYKIFNKYAISKVKTSPVFMWAVCTTAFALSSIFTNFELGCYPHTRHTYTPVSSRWHVFTVLEPIFIELAAYTLFKLNCSLIRSFNIYTFIYIYIIWVKWWKSVWTYQTFLSIKVGVALFSLGLSKLYVSFSGSKPHFSMKIGCNISTTASVKCCCRVSWMKFNS